MIRPTIILGSTVLLAAALAGCTRAPYYSIATRGTSPATQTSYRLVEGEAPALDPAVALALTAALARHGLTTALATAKPDLLLFAGLARRPARVGSFTRRNPGDADEAPGWIAVPEGRRRDVTTLSLRFVDPRTGHEVRAVRAEARHGRRPGDPVAMVLIESAASGQVPGVPSR